MRGPGSPLGRGLSPRPLQELWAGGPSLAPSAPASPAGSRRPRLHLLGLVHVQWLTRLGHTSSGHFVTMSHRPWRARVNALTPGPLRGKTKSPDLRCLLSSGVQVHPRGRLRAAEGTPVSVGLERGASRHTRAPVVNKRAVCTHTWRGRGGDGYP